MVFNESPSTPGAASNHDLRDASPQPRTNLPGTLPPQAAQAPEFIPGRNLRFIIPYQHADGRRADRNPSDASSDQDRITKKRPRPRREKRSKAEKTTKKEVQKQQAMEEEWWSGDEDFVPNLKNEEGLQTARTT
jgi:hypothetical protein